MIDVRVQPAILDGIANQLDPLILTSPLQRSGTPLLQRLLCSAPNTLIYGERAAQELEFFLSIHAYKVQEYGLCAGANDRLLSHVLRGQVNDWIIELIPDTGGYLRAIQQSAFAGISYCHEFAVANGRPVWGFKYPAWNPAVLRMLRRLMPHARLLFIARELIASLESAKAQRMMDTTQQLMGLCRSWLNGMSYIMELDDDPGVLSVRYEDLIERPAETLAAISSFTGAIGMNLAVLERRINVWAGQQFAAQSADGYIPPQELSESELQIVRQMMAEAESAVRV
jgi:hypothetical protein